MMTHRTLSSSSFTSLSTYSVFLSFGGIDTRTNFTGHLYDRLYGKGIKTFRDDEELRKGKEITPALVQAIQESRIAIVIFSKNYASSTFCLEELVKVLELMEQKDCSVLPVFYHVDPSDVKYQKGSFGKAFDNLINKRFKNDTEKVQKWKSTLKVAANLSGWHIKDGDEYNYVDQIVDEVSKRIARIPLHVANYPVGLESRVQKVKALLETEPNEGVSMVGVCGIGGIGKTTLACAVYNLIANDFEGVCFLKGIKENSTTDHDLAQLQKKLLADTLGEKDIKLTNVNEGITIIKHRLQKRKVLLILDDVDKLEQLQTLAGGLDWFGFGSRIIITTRDKHLLDAHCVERKYEVMGLNHEDAFELLSWNAFKRKKVEPSYMVLANNAVSYCNGLPLALEVVGSNFCNRSRDAWESAPNLNKYGVPIYSVAWVTEFITLHRNPPPDEISGFGDDAKSDSSPEAEAVKWAAEHYLAFAGGGGEGRSGIPNVVLLAAFHVESNSLSDQPVVRLGTDSDLPYRMSVHPRGEGIICAMPNSCRWFEWDRNDSAEIHKLSLKKSEKVLTQLEDVGQQLALAFNNDGTALAAGGEDGNLRVFKWPSMEIILNEARVHSTIKDLHFSSDGKLLVSLGSAGPCRVWDLSSTMVLTLLNENREAFSSCRFSQINDGTQVLYIASMTDKGGSILTWDTKTWERTGSKHIIRDPISAFNVSADGKFLACGTPSGDIVVVNSTKMQIHTIIKKAHLGIVTALTFSPDSRALVSVSLDSSARVTIIEDKKRKGGSGLWITLFILILAIIVYYLRLEGIVK